MNKVIQLHQDATVATPKEAEALARQIALGLPLSQAEEHSLYLHFVGCTHRPLKQAWRWLAKGVAVKDLRHYLNYVIIKDEVGYGTNGFTMHRAPMSGYNDGLYCPRTLVKEHSLPMHLPKMEKLMPRPDAIKNGAVYKHSALIRVVMNDQVYRGVKSELLVHDAFFVKAINGNETLDVIKPEFSSLIYGKHPLGDWIIHPTPHIY